MSLAKYAFHRLVVLALLVLVSGFGLGQVAATLQGHSTYITSVAFSPDGKTLASGSPDRTIKLWDVVSGRNIATLKGHTSHVTSVTFSPDGKTLASGSEDNTIKLWDVASSVNIATLKGHSLSVYSVAFSPDGKTLASGSWDSTIKLWDVTYGYGLMIATLQGHTGSVNSVAFSPDGKTLASGSWDSTIKLWDVASGRNIATLKGHTWTVSLVAFSPDSKTLASGSWDSTIKLWEVKTGKNVATLEGGSDNVLSIAFSPDSKILASNSDDSTIKFWDIASGRNIVTLRGHAGTVTSVAFSPDGNTLASGSYDNAIKLWDVFAATLPFREQQIRKLQGEMSSRKSIVENLLRGLTRIDVDNQPYLKVTTELLKELGLTLGGSRPAVQGAKGAVDLFSISGSLIRYTTQSIMEVERDGDQSIIYLPLASLGRISDRVVLDSINLALRFDYQSSEGLKGSYEVALPSSSGRLTYAELLARDQEVQAAAKRYAERQIAEKSRKETADYTNKFNRDYILAQQSLNTFAQTAIQVDGKIYLKAVDAPNWLNLSVEASQTFMGANSPVLLPANPTEHTIRTGEYVSQVYVPLEQLPSFSGKGTLASGTFTVDFSQTHTLSNGQLLVLKQALEITPSTSGPRYTYRDLLILHRNNLAAVDQYKLREEEAQFRDQLAEEAKSLQNELAAYLKLAIMVDGRAYVPVISGSSFPKISNIAPLKYDQSMVTGIKGRLKVFSGQGSAILYAPVSRSQLLKGSAYSPNVYIPIEKLPLLGTRPEYLLRGELRITFTYQYERSDGQLIPLTETVEASLPTKLPRLTHQQIIDQHKAAQSAVAEYRKAEANRVAKQEKARKDALHREEVMARNPQAVANFNAQVKKVQALLERIRQTALLVEGVPHFTFDSSSQLLGLQVKNGKVVGPNGQVGIMSGKGSAIKYSAQTQSDVGSGESYSPSTYIPLDKLPVLNKNIAWASSGTIKVKVERKVEDVVLSQLVQATVELSGRQKFTYAQLVQRHQMLTKAAADYAKAQTRSQNNTGAASGRGSEWMRNRVLGANVSPTNNELLKGGVSLGRLGSVVMMGSKYGFFMSQDQSSRGCVLELRSSPYVMYLSLQYYNGEPTVFEIREDGSAYLWGMRNVSSQGCQLLDTWN